MVELAGAGEGESNACQGGEEDEPKEGAMKAVLCCPAGGGEGVGDVGA